MLYERDYNRRDGDEQPIGEIDPPEHIRRLIARYRAEQAERDKDGKRLAFAKYLVDRGIINEGIEQQQPEE